jgi:hypothetical protein
MTFARAKRRDANEPEVVIALEAVGATVTRLDGDGVPVLLVGFKGCTFLLEVKNPNAKGGGKYNTGGGCLTAEQAKWWSSWTGEQAIIVYTPAEALAAIGADR